MNWGYVVKYEGYICFDLETTGLDSRRDQIIEIGAVRINSQGRIVDTFERQACPSIPIPREATEIHGIHKSSLRGFPPPHEIAVEFMRWASAGELLIAHNAPYDCAFLLAALGREAAKYRKRLALDTLRWSRAQLPHLRNHKLVTLAAHIKAQHKESHKALADASITHQLFLHLHRLSISPPTAIKACSMSLHKFAREYESDRAPSQGSYMVGPATERQLGFLRDLGASNREMAGISKREASRLIDRYIKKRDEHDSFSRGPKGLGLIGWLLLTLFLAGIVSAAFSGYPTTEPELAPVSATSQAIASGSGVAGIPVLPPEVFGSLSIGLTFEETRLLLGDDHRQVSRIQVPGRGSVSTHEWTLKDGSRIRVIFEDDWVTSWQPR